MKFYIEKKSDNITECFGLSQEVEDKISKVLKEELSLIVEEEDYTDIDLLQAIAEVCDNEQELMLGMFAGGRAIEKLLQHQKDKVGVLEKLLDALSD